MDDPEGVMNDPIATADQAAASSEQVARVVASYYRGLLRSGLTPHAALQLTLAYQATHFGVKS